MQPEYQDFWEVKSLQEAKDKIIADPNWDKYTQSVMPKLLTKAVKEQLIDEMGGCTYGCALEIGCGIGRLMKPMSNQFNWVYGIDISAEMLKHGRLYLSGTDNTTLIKCDGMSIPMKDDTIAFIYSVIVLQHIPSLPIILNYLRESKRVLKVGGVARFQTHIGVPSSKFDGFHGYFFPTLASFVSVFDIAGLKVIEKTREEEYLWVTAQKT